jgi:hypothetical protein
VHVSQFCFFSANGAFTWQDVLKHGLGFEEAVQLGCWTNLGK